MTGDRRFWNNKALTAMTVEEWESLCDGCGQCCLVKLEDEDSGRVHTTSVACRLLDCSTCRCRDYANRHHLVTDCVKLEPATVGDITWLPPTCAYRVLAEGGELAWWHPLVSGEQASVIAAGVSVMGRVISESEVDENELGYYLID
jgi:uncharacterized cysteine cluster protein YcgN (CxxCxxCC family)